MQDLKDDHLIKTVEHLIKTVEHLIKTVEHLIKTVKMKNQIIKTARQWLNTPYHHQARVKGVGVDCIGLIIGVCKELGLIDFDYNNYDRTPDSTMMMELIEKHCTPTDTPEEGDLLVFRIKKNPQHCGLMTDGGIIHAYQSVGKVVEHPLDEWWSTRIIGAFVLPI